MLPTAASKLFPWMFLRRNAEAEVKSTPQFLDPSSEIYTVKLKISSSGSSFDLNRARAKVKTTRAGVSFFASLFISHLKSRQNKTRVLKIDNDRRSRS